MTIIGLLKIFKAVAVAGRCFCVVMDPPGGRLNFDHTKLAEMRVPGKHERNRLPAPARAVSLNLFKR
jgi:hypothetical protein